MVSAWLRTSDLPQLQVAFVIFAMKALSIFELVAFALSIKNQGWLKRVECFRKINK